MGYQYFRSRGLEDETIRKYGLGWAPSSRQELANAARQAGYKEDFLTETGVCIKYDDGRLVDRFFDRVIFPIHSVSGRVIGFGGRTLKSDKSIAKYLNSPTSEIYDKRHTLYGIYFAKNEISRKDKCILVEGYLDVLSMHQLGVTNVVASSGTSLTVEQIRLIRKFTNNVTIIYDGDAAGIKAALRGIGLVLKEGLNVKVVLLPEGQDPDDFAKSHTLEEVQEHISINEQDFISFKTDLLLGEAAGDPLKKAALINDVADTIALIPDAVIRAVYVRTCAEKFGIDEQILADRVNNSRSAALLAEQQQIEREQVNWERRQQYQQQTGQEMPGPEMQASDPLPPPVKENDPLLMNEPSLAPCEKEILGFILEDGCSVLCFDRDSKYYVEGEEVTVAEFIDGTLAADDAELMNEPYRKVYDEFFRMYDEGMSQEQIRVRLLNSMDETISRISNDILIEKYQITVKNYEQSLTANSTRLVQFVPKAMLAYQIRKVELIINGLTAELDKAADEARQIELFTKISDYTKARSVLSKELGRV